MTHYDQGHLLQAALRQDLGAFIAKAFQTVSPGDRYLHNWHIDAIAYQLMEVHHRRNRRLIINQPPRSLKSICTSVAYVAWALGQDPSLRFACVSYSSELAAVLARQFRLVINSDWYQALFPGTRFTKETETDCETSKGGGRFSVSVGGSFTGRGADIILIDDPLKADDAQSEKARKTVNEWYGGTLVSRLDDKDSGAIVLVMQRLHEDDLAGKLLDDGGWRHLDLPAIGEEDQRIQIGPNAHHDRKKGQVLHPERESQATLDQLKGQMGTLVFSAQYQQRPVPAEGNKIKRNWIEWFTSLPEELQNAQVIQSWDLATTTGDYNDYSACTTWVCSQRHYYLIDVWRGRLEFPALKRKIIDLAKEHEANTILIEQAGPGLPMIQEFKNKPVSGVPIPIGIKPEKDKVVRMLAHSSRFEAGQIHVKKDAAWVADFLHELLAFPNARHDDQVDSVSQFLGWAEKRAFGHTESDDSSLYGRIIIGRSYRDIYG